MYGADPTLIAHRPPSGDLDTAVRIAATDAIATSLKVVRAHECDWQVWCRNGMLGETYRETRPPNPRWAFFLERGRDGS